VIGRQYFLRQAATLFRSALSTNDLSLRQPWSRELMTFYPKLMNLDIAGWSSGYAGKIFAPEPIKNLGWMSLGVALKTMAIKLVVVEDPEQRKLVESRWQRRERPRNAPSASGQSRPGRSA
jgi:hypothetical protein